MIIIQKHLEVYDNTIEMNAFNDAGVIDRFPDSSASFKIKQKIAGQTGYDETKDVEIAVQLRYLGNCRRAVEMPLTKYEINLILTWPAF